MTVEGGDVLRCTVEMHYESFGAIQNVYHMRNDGGNISDALAIADVVEALEALMGVIAAIIAVLQVVDGVRIINATTSTDVGFGVFVDTTPFTGVGEVLPTQVAGGLNLTTTRLSVGGRKYFGAGAAGLVTDGGIIEAASLTILALAGVAMTSLFAATNNDWRWGVIASLDGVFLPFQSYSIPTMAIIQRRRRLGVGI